MLYLDASDTPSVPVTPDTEISKDGGGFLDCIEEVTTIGTGTGSGYLTLNGAEMGAALVVRAGKGGGGAARRRRGRRVPSPWRRGRPPTRWSAASCGPRARPGAAARAAWITRRA